MARLPYLEPGALSVLRLFMGGQFVVLGLPLSQGQPPSDALAVVGWVSATVVLASLIWGRVYQLLGSLHLPLVVGLLTLGPVIALPASVAWRMGHGMAGEAAQIEPGLYLPWLMLPLVLLSTQFGLRVLVLFSVGTSFFTGVMALVLAAHGGPEPTAAVQDAIMRAILFTIVGSLIVLLSRSQRQQRELVANQALTLEQLTISRERNRLARELHDTLAHTLSALSVQLAALDATWDADPIGAHQRAQQAYTLTRQGLDEVRHALHALRASQVEALGLALALQHLANMAATRVDMELSCAVPATLPAIPVIVAEQCYRIVEEALNNVVRHAHAHQMRVECHHDGKKLTLIVADDGQGFDALSDPPPGHFGLIGMRERALLIGAAFVVQSRPQRGTTIRVTWQGERMTR